MNIKAFLVIIVLLMHPFLTNSQSWHKQDILNEVSVDFPGIPERTQLNQKIQSYDFTSECCVFSVGVVVNAIESYDQYSSLSDTNKLKFVDNFLNSVAAGMINEQKQHFISAADRQVGKLLIKEVVYSDKDPSLKGSRKRYSALVLINNHLYTFSCWYRDDKLHEEERKKFFLSIRVKN